MEVTEQNDTDKERLHFKVISFINEAGIKLSMKSIPLATAATLYHKFFAVTDLKNYDPYLIAMTCLYLASKVEENHVRIRDVINVSYRCLHAEKPPLDIGPTYWQLRDSLVQCELLVIRMLNFHVSFQHPHKYILHYMKSLKDWLPPRVFDRIPVVQTAWAILRDSYHSKTFLKINPQHMAVAVLYMSLQCHGVEVPYNNHAQSTWWQSLCEDLSLSEIRSIISQIIDIYDLEKR